MREYEMITRMATSFLRHPHQFNHLFTSDAEIIPIGNELWAVTIDDFSPEEDRFTAEDPQRLGANLVTATLCDIYAVAAQPALYLHALTLPHAASDEFRNGLIKGMSGVLREAQCCFLGGDFSQGVTWRYCGVAMGRVMRDQPLTRQMPRAPQSLWISGPLGDANFAALTGQATPRFELRLPTTALIRGYAGACIDTSSGLGDALWLLHTMNPNMCLTIDIAAIPLALEVLQMSERTGIPAEACLLGGAGEYEFCFSMPDPLDRYIGTTLRDAGAWRIGTAEPCNEASLRFMRGNREISRMTTPPPCSREIPDLNTYISAVIDMARKLFVESNEGTTR